MSLMEALAKFFQTPPKRESRQVRPVRITLEALEDRTVPTEIDVWIGSSSANWSDDANWSLGHAPDADDVVYFSNSANCTVNVNVSVLDIDCTGYSGQLTVAAGVTLSTPQFTQDGTLNLLGGSTLSVGSFAAYGVVNAPSTNAAISASGVFGLESGGSILVPGGGGGTPGLTINAAAEYAGSVNVAGQLDLTGSFHQIIDTMTVTGLVNVTGGGNLELGGTLVLSGGTVDVSASFTGILDLTNGTVLSLAAGDTIIGNVINCATITYGGDAHWLTVTGDYEQSSLGTLAMRIGSGFGNDLLVVEGTANLGGTLEVSLVGGETDSAPLISLQGGLTGDFTTKSFPSPGPGYHWVCDIYNNTYTIYRLPD